MEQKQKNFYKEIEDKLAVLQQQTDFCLKDYDYHHHGNELQILSDQLQVIKQAATDAERFLQRINSFRDSVVAAQRKCDEVDGQLSSLGLISESISTNNNSGEESNCGDS